MSDPISFEELGFSLTASMAKAGTSRETDPSFQILIMGDFSGRDSRLHQNDTDDSEWINPSVLMEVDRDNIDDVIKKLGVTLCLDLPGSNHEPVRISFSEMDDFHPDALFRGLSIFQDLKSTAKAIAANSSGSKDQEKEEPVLPPEPVDIAPEGLLDQIIANSKSDKGGHQIPENSGQTAGPLDSFLKDIVTPHLIPKDDQDKKDIWEATDLALGELMQRILHHPFFKNLEAAWRGVHFLISRLETDNRLKVFLLDISKQKLADDLMCVDDLSKTRLYKQYIESPSGNTGGRSWAVIAGNYTFDKKGNDLQLLGRMATLAAAAGTSFITAAADTFLCKQSLALTPDPDDWGPADDPETEKIWRTLRHNPLAAHLGLSLPGFLLRLPYGDNTEPIDEFDFEEISGVPCHENYLWGNPCFAVVLLLGQTYSHNGSQMEPGSILEIPSLPLHIFKDQGESRATPCSEALLTMRAAERILDAGMMPLLSFQNQDMVRLGRFQSIADPPARLAGPWR